MDGQNVPHRFPETEYISCCCRLPVETLRARKDHPGIDRDQRQTTLPTPMNASIKKSGTSRDAPRAAHSHLPLASVLFMSADSLSVPPVSHLWKVQPKCKWKTYGSKHRGQNRLYMGQNNYRVRRCGFERRLTE